MDSALVRRDPEIIGGALCISGTRVPMKNLFDYLEDSSSLEEFLEGPRPFEWCKTRGPNALIRG